MKAKPVKFKYDSKRLKDGIYFAKTANQYRYKSSDRKLSDRQLQKIVAQELARYEMKALKLTNRFLNGSVSFEDWQKGVAKITRDGNINMLRLGRGDAENTFAIHYLEVGRRLKDLHYPALFNFSMQVKAGRLSEKQILARVPLYTRSSRYGFEYGVDSRAREKGGVVESRRKLGGGCDHCPECLTYAARGWVNLSDQIMPTEACSCGSNCCCTLEYR